LESLQHSGAKSELRLDNLAQQCGGSQRHQDGISAQKDEGRGAQLENLEESERGNTIKPIRSKMLDLGGQQVKT